MAALLGQAIAGHAEYNNQALAHTDQTLSFSRSVVSSEFGQAVMENWQSEYLHSLLIVVGAIWVVSWFAQSVTGWSAYNADQIEHHEQTLNWLQYLGSADFWQTTLQNWQSEFLAVGSTAVLAIYLRQRGSPESKPVGTPHAATGVEG